MHAADHKCEDQKSGHAPECPEEIRILAGIVMGSMREITGEPAGRPWMALLTCVHNICVAQARAWIPYLEDVVSTVAVVTLCRFRISQLRYFAMIGVEVRLCNFLMTSPALLHDLQLETLIVRPPNRMRRVTIVTHWESFVRFPNPEDVDALPELFFNPMMAPTTGRWNVFRIDAGLRIREWLDTVRRMAVGAGCRNRETTFQQPLAMDALCVVLDDLVLCARIANGCLLTLPVTASTEGRDICGKGWG